MNTQEFRTKLASAITAGRFVPVLGAQVSTSSRWANAPHRDFWECLDQPRGRSVQRVEAMRAETLGCRVAVSLSSPEHWLSSRETAYENLSTPLKRYLATITGTDDPAEAACELPTERVEVLLHELRTEVTALSFILNRAWATSLTAAPRPLSSRLTDDELDADTVEFHREVISEALAGSLDACAALWNAADSGEVNEPAMLKLEWVYGKLLVLASRVVRDADEARQFWSERPGFARRHSDFVEERSGECGWIKDGGAYPALARPKLCGPRASHALWAEALRVHCMLAGSRLYRTNEQVVFLLALDDAVDDLLNVTVDPSEIGLVYREQLRNFERGRPSTDTLPRDIRTLRALHTFCSTMEDGSHRPPDALHRSLARLLAKSHAQHVQPTEAAPASARRPRSTTSAAPKLCREVVLSMSMDLEMERAIEEQFTRYRVLVPARVPADVLRLSEDEATGIAPLEGDYWATWCLGQFDRETSDGGLVAEHWCWTDDVGGEACEVTAMGDGPLIVKLFGSPLHDLPAPARHRIVMDESDLLRLMQDLLPRKVKDLDTVVRQGELYFFGQDAVTWSERTPFYMVVRHHGEPQKGESRDGDVRGSEGIFAAMDVGRLRIEGASALRSLNIDWPKAEELGEIALSVVAEAYQ